MPGLTLPRSISLEDYLDPESQINQRINAQGYGIKPPGWLGAGAGPGSERADPGSPMDLLNLPGKGLDALMARRLGPAPPRGLDVTEMRRANDARAALPDLAAARATPERKGELRQELEQMRAQQLGEPAAPPTAAAAPLPGPTANPLGAGGGVPQTPGMPLAEGRDLTSRVTSLGDMPGAPTEPKQDYEAFLQGVERDEGIENLTMAREISEGLKLAGRSLVGLSGAQIPGGDDKSYGIRDKLEQAEDELTPAERQMLESKGLKIPPGMRRSHLVGMGVIPEHFRERGDQKAQEFTRERDVAQREHQMGMEGLRTQRAAQAQTTAEAKELRTYVAKEREAWRSKTNKFGLYNQAIEATGKVDGLLAERTNQSFNTALTIVLKGMAGEAGNIAQKERQALANEMGIPGIWNYIGGSMWSGKPTDAQFDAIGRIAKIIGQRQKQELQKYSKGQLDTAMESDLVKQSGMSRQELLRKVQGGPEADIDASTEDIVVFTDPSDPDWSWDVPKSQVDEFKRLHPTALRLRK